jgi:hypothetical protein
MTEWTGVGIKRGIIFGVSERKVLLVFGFLSICAYYRG